MLAPNPSKLCIRDGWQLENNSEASLNLNGIELVASAEEMVDTFKVHTSGLTTELS